ncbi:MAG: aminomethyl transferase family protein [Halieaceae bacterium]|jgi:aminomethyltransferase|nr:aminomethyltransferase [marine gamma proteobacterium HTCC2080]MBT3458854.1 aminomethyl transferase family protein [Halieaceae bacterium]MDG1829621.1 aminomethyltransferase family protein [Luminiphilus sp.]MBT4853518.1 aminomethyl transferase family protein [Halieaceae bacterium]MBT5209430.1 aminomethyl transferase family protein [Halieaceae bacterium]
MITSSRDIMLLPTPFHSRVEAMCDMNDWGNWMGYTTPNAYFDVELEYFAIRSTTGVFDLSPMNKYRITGPDAEAYLNRMVTRNVSKLGINRVGYAVWCNDAGQVMDDGTIFRLGEQDFRLCSYQRADDWLAWCTLGFDVTITNESEDLAGLAVQGPTSCTILTLLGCTGLDQLKPFGIAHFTFEGAPMMVSRTGFTGDLGYEVWVAPAQAEALWDQLFEHGREYLIKPIGSYALDMARIEAGFIQAHVDFVPAEEVVRNGRTRSPFELGLEWLVDFSKPLFNGRSALLAEKAKGSRYRFAMLDIEGNKPAEHSFIMKGDKVVGTVTSAAWCPTVKSNIAYAQLEMPHGAVGDELVAEIYYQRELHWTRMLAPCRVIDGPLFNPKRRRQTPAPPF